MTYTSLSSLGGRVCVDGRGGETIVTAKSDGALIAGSLVYIIGTAGATRGDIAGTDVNGSVDQFTGILLEHYDVDCDTAVADGDMVEVVIPRSGRHYIIRIDDLGANSEVGSAVIFGDNAGIAKDQAGIEDHTIARISKFYTDNDTFVEVVWA